MNLTPPPVGHTRDDARDCTINQIGRPLLRICRSSCEALLFDYDRRNVAAARVTIMRGAFEEVARRYFEIIQY